MHVMVIVMHEWSVEFGNASHNWCLPNPGTQEKVRTEQLAL